MACEPPRKCRKTYSGHRSAWSEFPETLCFGPVVSDSTTALSTSARLGNTRSSTKLLRDDTRHQSTTKIGNKPNSNTARRPYRTGALLMIHTTILFGFLTIHDSKIPFTIHHSSLRITTPLFLYFNPTASHHTTTISPPFRQPRHVGFPLRPAPLATAYDQR